MAESINDLLNEADSIIESRVDNTKTASLAIQDNDDDIVSLAAELDRVGVQFENTKYASLTVDLEETPFEKVAHAIAILETVQFINQEKELEKIAKLAQERGIPQVEIDSFLQEKRASFGSMINQINIPEEFNA